MKTLRSSSTLPRLLNAVQIKDRIGQRPIRNSGVHFPALLGVLLILMILVLSCGTD